MQVIRTTCNCQIKHTAQGGHGPIQRKRRGPCNIAARKRGKAADILGFERHLQLGQQPGIHTINRRFTGKTVIFARKRQTVDLNRLSLDKTDLGAAGDRVTNGR